MKGISYYGIGICLALTMVSCSDTNEQPSSDENKIVNLSALEMANCYIVQSPGTYEFKADNQFNLGEGLPVPPEMNPESAVLLWQTVPGSISSVSLTSKDGTPYIEFEVAEAKGNALLAALNAEGEIEWSWHIWMPEEKVESILMDNGYEVMSMNLGAMNNRPGDPEAYGLLYQWGRKDPFPAAPTLTGDTNTVGAPLYDIEGNPVNVTNSSWTSTANNTIAFSIANPTVCLSNYSQYSTSRDWLKSSESNDALWGNPQGDFRDSDTNTFPNKGRKTCYDPSPAGWRVAPADAFRSFTTSGGYAWTFEDFDVADINGDGKIDMGDYDYGWHFNIGGGKNLYFPAAARYDGSFAMLMGSMSGLWGNYWSNSPYSTISGGAFCALAFQTKSQTGQEMITVSPSGGGGRADAYSVRCVRE